MTGGRHAARVEALLTDARAAAAAGDWEDVRDLAAAVVALVPGQAEAMGLLRDADARLPGRGERRQLTVMFCDVVGSTSLSEQHDPEILREVLRAYQRTVDDVVTSFGGHLALYIGDGVLVYFGHPSPHEDDPRRGVGAGLELLEALRPVAEAARREHGIDLSVRVAVHTGMVVVADMGSLRTPSRDAIIGETPNLAARLQDAARPGTMVISEATRALVSGFFVTAPLGELNLKGFTRPVLAHEVLAVDDDADRLRAQRQLTTFVGRAEELGVLDDRWDAVVGGGAHALVVRGEAGIGKSRLADVARRRIDHLDGRSLACACSAFHTNTDLYPARRLVASVAGLDDLASSIGAPLLRLQKALDAVELGEHTAVAAALLQLPLEPWCRLPEIDAMALRERTLWLVEEWVARAAQRRPLLLLVEDVQWADPSTADLLQRIIARKLPGLLVVLTSRDLQAQPWRGAEALDLGELGPDDLDRIALDIPGGERLPAVQRRDIIRRSDGNPLFLEELVRAAQIGVQVTSTLRPVAADIPTALRDLLLARFSAPGIDLDLAQTLATIGHEASRPFLAAVARVDEDVVHKRMQGLLDAQLVDQDGFDPPVYRFHHHLLAEMAYDTQLLPARQERHGRVADAIRAGDDPALTDAGALAYHLDQAGRIEEAVDAHLRAAVAMQDRAAHAEATNVLTEALRLVDRIEDDERRRAAEVRILGRRGMSAVATLGYGAPSAAQDFERARRLLGDTVSLGELIVETQAIWSYYVLRGELDEAELVLGSQLAGAPADSLLGKQAVSFLGLIRFFRGDLEQAERDLAASLHHPDWLQLGANMPIYWRLPNDPVAALQSHLALVAALRGRPGAANAHIDDATRRVEALAFPYGPFTACYVAAVANMTYLALGLLDRAEAAVEELAAVAERHQFVFWTASAAVQRASLAVRRGVPGATTDLGNAVMILRALGAEVYNPGSLTDRGAGILAEGDAAGALVVLEEAKVVADRTGSVYWSSETARWIGIATRQAGLPGALGHLTEAVDIAVRQGAKLFELRARTELCRLVDDDSEHKALAELVDASDPGLVEDLAAANGVLADRTGG